MRAALSYYALFSLFPTFLVLNSVLGFLIGSETMVFQRILIFAEAAFPTEAVNIIQDVIKGTIELVETMNRAIALIHLDNLWIAQQLHWISAFFLVALAVLFLFRFLPSTEIAWGDLWPATVLTASLLVGLQNLVSRNIIQIGVNYQSYGVVGSVMILMLWVYLTCQIFFFGYEFSYVYIHLYGSRRHQDFQDLEL